MLPHGQRGKTKGGIRPCGRLAALRQLLLDLAIVGYNNDMSLYTFQDNVTKIQGAMLEVWCFVSANHKNENQFAAATVHVCLNDEGWGNIGIVTGNTWQTCCCRDGRKSTDDCRRGETNINRWITANGTTSSSMPAILEVQSPRYFDLWSALVFVA